MYITEKMCSAWNWMHSLNYAFGVILNLYCQRWLVLTSLSMTSELTVSPLASLGILRSMPHTVPISCEHCDLDDLSFSRIIYILVIRSNRRWMTSELLVEAIIDVWSKAAATWGEYWPFNIDLSSGLVALSVDVQDQCIWHVYNSQTCDSYSLPWSQKVPLYSKTS